MALTKVSGGILDPGINVAGIVTATGFDGPFTGGSSRNITAGIITATGLDVNGNGDISGNLVIGGNLTANGDFTTLNTTLREVELLRVSAASTLPAGIITQTGSGDILNLYDGSTEVFSVSDGGDLTLGGGKIYGDDNAFNVLTLQSTSGNNNHSRIDISANESDNGGIHFYTAGSSVAERRITIKGTTGNVGINTASPAFLLDVVDNATDAEIRIRQLSTSSSADTILRHSIAGTTASNKIYFGDANDVNAGEIKYDHSDDSMQFTANASEALRIDSSGRVGIGTDLTTTPSSTLTVSPYNSTSGRNISIYTNGSVGNKAGLFFNATPATGNLAEIQAEYKGTNEGELVLSTSMQKRLTINKDGEVGIGITNPSDMLHVVGSGRFIKTSNNYVHVGSSNAGGAAIVLDGDSNGDGVGADYAYIEHDTSGDLNIVVDNPANAGNIKFFTNTSSERLRITGIGSVGINEDQPRAFLHVASDNGQTLPEISASFPLIVTKNSNSGIAIIAKNDAKSILAFGDTDDADRGKIQYVHTSGDDVDSMQFITAGGTRWKFDSSGHFLPGTASAVNIGSASAEIGNVYIADSKNIFFGNEQDAEIYHSGSHLYLQNGTGNLYIRAGGSSLILRGDNNKDGVIVNATTTFLYHDNSIRLETTGIGVTVTGEIGASQDYPDFRPTLDLNFAAEKKLDSRITYSRTGAASFIDKFGLVKIVGDNVPRFDHDLDTRECKGLLIEESRTNIHPYSQDLSNWTVESGGSVTANTHTSPAGDQTADSLHGTQSGSSGYRTFPLTSGTAYTFTVFMKHVSGEAVIDIQIGDAPFTRSNTKFNTSTGALVSNTGGTATVNDVVFYGNGWYRYSITRTPTSTASGFMDINHTSSTASTVAVWGAQVEAGAFATSYFPVHDDTTATRGADIVDIDGEDFTDFYNQTEGTIISSHTLLSGVPNAENVYVYQIQDATTNNAIRVVDKNSSYSNVATGLVINASSSQFHFNNTIDSFSKNKVLVALSVKQNDFAGCHNGGTVETDTSGTLATNFNSIGIGRYPPSSGYELNGHIQRFIYYPKQLSDSQLKTLTS